MADDIGFEPIDATIPAAPQDNIGFEPIDGSNTPGTFARIGAAWKNAVGSINPGTAKAAVGDYIANTVTGVPNTLLKHGVQYGAYLSGQDDSQAQQTANRVVPNFTIQPATPGGQALVSAVGTTLQPISDAGKAVGVSIGMSPAGQNLAGDFLPAVVGKAGGTLGDVAAYAKGKAIHAVGDSLVDQYQNDMLKRGDYSPDEIETMTEPGGQFDQLRDLVHNKLNGVPEDGSYDAALKTAALNQYLSDTTPYGVGNVAKHIADAGYQGLKDTTGDLPTAMTSGAAGFMTGHPLAGIATVIAKHAVNGAMKAGGDAASQVVGRRILANNVSTQPATPIVAPVVSGVNNVVSPVVQTGVVNQQPIDIGFEPIDQAPGLQGLIDRLGSKYQYGN